MYVGNQKGDFFPSDDVDGDPSPTDATSRTGDPRRRWVGFANLPNNPRVARDIEDNDCLNPVGFVCKNSGDTDFDGDLFRIATYVYAYSIRGIASTYCHFAEARGWVPGGTCPVDSGPYIEDSVFAQIDEDVDDEVTNWSEYQIKTDQTVTVDYLWSDNQSDSNLFVGILSSEAFAVRAGDVVKIGVWKDENPVSVDEFEYYVLINNEPRARHHVEKQHWGASLIKLNFREYVPAAKP